MNQIFKIGEEVIALTDPINKYGQPRVKGQKYTVKDVMYCSKCGEQLINIGVIDSDKNAVILCDCGNKQDNNGLHWTYSGLFIRPQDLHEALKEAVESENFELAVTLQNAGATIYKSTKFKTN